MKNKPLYLLSLISAGLLCQTGVTASPLVSIGDNTDIFFNGSSSLRWQSNVFRNENNEKDDLLWTVSPGFEVNVGRGLSNADLSIITRYDILRYQDQTQLNTDQFHVKAIGSYSASRLDLKGLVSYDQEQQNSGEANVQDGLVEYDRTNARLNGEYRFSPKFSFGTGVGYAQKEYKTFEDRFADTETWRVPSDLYYELTPKVDLSAGYTYAHKDIESTRVASSYTTQSNFYNVGFRGNLLPKLTGFFKVGYTTLENDRAGSDDTGMLGLNGDLAWTATPKFTARLALSRQFGVAGEGQSTENTSANLSGNYAISSYITAILNLGYTNRDYTNTDREDDQYNVGARLAYTPNQYWRFSTGYKYVDNDSSARNQSYNNHIIDLSASLRY